jgi:hypothetical protein
MSINNSGVSVPHSSETLGNRWHPPIPGLCRCFCPPSGLSENNISGKEQDCTVISGVGKMRLKSSVVIDVVVVVQHAKSPIVILVVVVVRIDRRVARATTTV